MYDAFSNFICEYRISKGLMLEEDYDNLDIKIRNISFIILSTVLFLILGYLLNCLLELFVIYIICNVLKYFSFYHHLSLDKCTIFSILYLIVLSLISKYTIQFGTYAFFICILLFLVTINNVPNIPLEDKKKSNDFYIKVYVLLFSLLIIIGVIFFTIHSNILLTISNAIFIGIISVELFLTKIGFKIFQLIDKI